MLEFWLDGPRATEDGEVVLVVSGQQSYNLTGSRPTAHAGIPTTTRTRVEACDADRLYCFRTLNLKTSNVLCNQNSNKPNANP